MTLFLAAISIAAPAADPLPVILIVSHAGSIIAWRPEDHDKFAHFGLEVAVWADGRIVWGKAEKKFNGRLYRQCYEATIGPSRVNRALEVFRAGQAFTVRNIHRSIPCSGSTNVVARLRGESLSWSYSGDPDPAYSDDESPASWRKSVQAWNLVTREARALIPRHGLRIKSVDFPLFEMEKMFPTSRG